MGPSMEQRSNVHRSHGNGGTGVQEHFDSVRKIPVQVVVRVIASEYDERLFEGM
jgi:hypothetical protein